MLSHQERVHEKVAVEGENLLCTPAQGIVGEHLCIMGSVDRRQMQCSRHLDTRMSSTPLVSNIYLTFFKHIYHTRHIPEMKIILPFPICFFFVVGIAREHCEVSGNGMASMLAEIQSRLFDLGAAVATVKLIDSVSLTSTASLILSMYIFHSLRPFITYHQTFHMLLTHTAGSNFS